MSRLTIALGSLAALGLGFGVWQFVERQSMASELARLRADAAARALAPQAAPAGDPWAQPAPVVAAVPTAGTTIGNGPALQEAPKETRLERRARRTEEMMAMFGRLEGETDEEYKQRFGPMVDMFFTKRRRNLANLRKQMEETANITPEQSAKLDQAFDKVYADALDYTNQAVKEGLLSPYQRDVSSMLEFAGGLGGMLRDAEGQIGTILSAEQVKTIYDSGFEWGEYLGVNAPWEQLNPPPANPPAPQ